MQSIASGVIGYQLEEWPGNSMKNKKYCKECGDKFDAKRVYHNTCASCIEVKYGDIRIESSHGLESEDMEFCGIASDWVDPLN